MKLTKQALELLLHFEGFSLKAYKCPAGVWTIGIGCTYYPDGTKVKEGDILASPAEVFSLKHKILEGFIQGLWDMLEPVQKHTYITENEFSAMVCLAYNIGLGSFKNSRVLKFLRDGDKYNASKSFLLWNKVNGKITLGLVRRRYAEMLMFQGKNWSEYEEKRLEG